MEGGKLRWKASVGEFSSFFFFFHPLSPFVWLRSAFWDFFFRLLIRLGDPETKGVRTYLIVDPFAEERVSSHKQEFLAMHLYSHVIREFTQC